MADGQVDVAQIEKVLESFLDPETGRSALKNRQIQDIQVDGDRVSLSFGLTSFASPLWRDVEEGLQEQIRSKLPQIKSVDVKRVPFDRPPQKLGQVGLTVKSVIAVGSGKGGVGKSTIAASLAYALNRSGAKVGLMDADVYGPSIPMLTGTGHVTKEEVAGEGGRLVPVNAGGIQVMSLGYLVSPEQAVIWRGPMLHKTVTHFLAGTEWDALDYLIVDMPPGTGDVALTLSQSLPLTGAVVVCTPQDVALLDAVKAITMFQTVKIPVLGIVENMSGFLCPDCNKRYDIFGSGGARQRAEQMTVPFLGDVPINIQIRVHGDEGKTDANFDDPAVAPYLEKIAYRLVRDLAQKAQQEPPKPQLPVLG